MYYILLAVAIISLCRLALADDGSFNATSNSIYRCGIRKRFGVQPGSVFKSQEAELGQWPWHVGLYHEEYYKCGGTLIDQRHILTAAHCVTAYEIGKKNRKQRKKVAMNPSIVRIHLGQHIIGEFPEQVQIKNVSEIHVHPGFSPNRDDIALLVLFAMIQMSEFVIPICLVGSRDPKWEDLVDKRGWVVGWNMMSNETILKALKTTQMPVVSHEECVRNDPILFGRLISPETFCAGNLNGTTVCRGDTGGGMYLLAGDRWELRGITSFSRSTS